METNNTHPSTYYVDLDGTLAHYTGWKSPEDIGDPIPAMMDRVKAWLMEGKPVKIFTARFPEHHGFVREWLFRHGLGGIPVTNVKGIDGKEFWDDRAVPVEPNTGRNLIEALDRLNEGRARDADTLRQYMEEAAQFRNTITAMRAELTTLQSIRKGRAAHVKHLAEVEADRDGWKKSYEEEIAGNRTILDKLRAAGCPKDLNINVAIDWACGQLKSPIIYKRDQVSEMIFDCTNDEIAKVWDTAYRDERIFVDRDSSEHSQRMEWAVPAIRRFFEAHALGRIDELKADVERTDLLRYEAALERDNLRMELEAVTKMRDEAIEKWKLVDSALASITADRDGIFAELKERRAEQDPIGEEIVKLRKQVSELRSKLLGNAVHNGQIAMLLGQALDQVAELGAEPYRAGFAVSSDPTPDQVQGLAEAIKLYMGEHQGSGWAGMARAAFAHFRKQSIGPASPQPPVTEQEIAGLLQARSGVPCDTIDPDSPIATDAAAIFDLLKRRGYPGAAPEGYPTFAQLKALWEEISADPETSWQSDNAQFMHYLKEIFYNLPHSNPNEIEKESAA